MMDLPLLLCTLTSGLVELLLLELIRRFILSEPQGKRTVNKMVYFDIWIQFTLRWLLGFSFTLEKANDAWSLNLVYPPHTPPHHTLPQTFPLLHRLFSSFFPEVIVGIIMKKATDFFLSFQVHCIFMGIFRPSRKEYVFFKTNIFSFFAFYNQRLVTVGWTNPSPGVILHA